MVVRSRAARFAVYGALGLCGELAFTSLNGYLRDRGAGFRGRTSPWMFPVYGLVQPLFEPAHDAMRDRVPAALRAALYAAGFLAVEYASGRALRRLRGAAPWNYSGARWNVDGLVRMDYGPVWAAAGLALEPVHDLLTGRPDAVPR